MSNPEMEEMAALHAVGLLEGADLKTLLEAAERDADVEATIRSFSESAALLVYDFPQSVPPPSAWRELTRQLPSRRAEPIVLPFPQWIPFALAACLVGVTIIQAIQISHLHKQVRSADRQLIALQERNNMTELKLASLQAKDASYSSAKVMVAWDPKLHKGVISMDHMPAPPPGHDYQLWVLDPSSPGPVSAGLLSATSRMEGFAVRPVSTAGPGFAISLEPSGGRPTPTGTILFAVAPGL